MFLFLVKQGKMANFRSRGVRMSLLFENVHWAIFNSFSFLFDVDGVLRCYYASASRVQICCQAAWNVLLSAA